MIERGVSLRLGVVGLGFAARLMLPAVVRHSRFRLAAAVDVRPEARQRFEAEFGVRAFAEIGEMLAADVIDAAYLATPSYLHATQMLELAAAGKHLIVEKPLVLTEQELRQVQQAVLASGVSVICGHTHGFDAPVALMAELIASGAVGEARMVSTMNYTDLMYRPRSAWELDVARGGGAVFMQAPHQIDVIRRLAPGRVASVSAQVMVNDRSRRADGAYSAFLRFDSGAVASAVYSGYGYFDTAQWNGWRDERGQPRSPTTHRETWQAYRAQAYRKTAAGPDSLDEARRNERRYGAATSDIEIGGQPFFGVTIASCECADLYQSGNGVVVCDREGPRELPADHLPDAWTALLSELHDSVVDGGPAPHGLDWAIESTRVCIALHESSRLGREVLLDDWRLREC